MKKLSTLNSQLSTARGFTLVEVIVVIGVFIILSTIILSILITVIREAKKSDSVISVRQDGQHAMDQITRNLRFAKSLDPATTCDGATQLNKVTITTVDLSQINFSCPSSPSNPITMNSANLTNSNITAITANSCHFICTQSAGAPPAIDIFFKLSKVNPNQLIEENTNIQFQSSVILRNIE